MCLIVAQWRRKGSICWLNSTLFVGIGESLCPGMCAGSGRHGCAHFYLHVHLNVKGFLKLSEPQREVPKPCSVSWEDPRLTLLSWGKEKKEGMRLGNMAVLLFFLPTFGFFLNLIYLSGFALLRTRPRCGLCIQRTDVEGLSSGGQITPHAIHAGTGQEQWGVCSAVFILSSSWSGP